MKKKLVLFCLIVLTALCAMSCGPDSFEADSGQEANEPVTALSLMKEINTSDETLIDDNYRTFYEVFVYSFYDSDGDGIGDLNGLIEKLDYINDGDPQTDTDLGCTGIWLMPIMPSTTYHKYDVTDYMDIDSEYGTLEDFEILIEECHERGINVIIDFVMNHTSSQHEWFLSACEYLKGLSEDEEPDADTCPYVEYYNFSRDKESSAYYQVDGTDWYYEAQFWSEMPDLNWDCEAVKAEFEEIVSFWLDMGVDGFRLDAVTSYYTGNDEKNIEVLTWFNSMVKEKKEDAYIVAEAWTDGSVYAQYYASGIDSLFNFDFADSDGIISRVVSGKSGASYYGESLVSAQDLFESYSSTYIDAPFYTNHDMGRSAGYYAGDESESQTKIAQAMNLLMSGSAFLYYGEELGMKGSGDDENKRAPMYWSDDESAEGMCAGPEDMDDFEMKFGSLEEQLSDGNSIYYYVKEVIALRNQFPAIARGDVSFLEEYSDENLCVITKTYEDETVTIVFNICPDEQSLDLSADEDADTLSLSGVLLTEAEPVTFEDGVLTMPAYSVAILK